MKHDDYIRRQVYTDFLKAKLFSRNVHSICLSKVQRQDLQTNKLQAKANKINEQILPLKLLF